MGAVTFAAITADDRDEFLAAVAASTSLHAPWVEPPATRDAFDAYLQRLGSDRSAGYLLRLSADRSLVGVVNLSEIVRGRFQNAYLGYFALAPNHGKGLMKAGLQGVIAHAFTELGLHRVEANIQPENTASIELVKRLGFRKEGFSPRYLHIDGDWRDHERWALTAEELS